MKTTRSIMGMPVTVEALGSHATALVLEKVFGHFTHVDQIFSTYKSDSEISRLNRNELAADATLPEVQAVLRECEDLKQKTHGYFDIHNGSDNDPSGYVKGWAIKQAAEILDSHGIVNYCVDAGGDMQLRGNGPSGLRWKVGIKHPHQPAKFAKIVYLTDCALATSGTYERGRHIYNPLTGLAVEDPVSLSVIGPSIDRVDAFTTAAFCMGRDGLTFLHSLGYQAMMITQAGEVLLTLGFRHYEKAI